MCIDFIDFNYDIIHGQPKDTQEKSGEIKGKQEKAITQSAIERTVIKLERNSVCFQR